MQQLEFNGSGTEYFKIWIVNILLTVVTFGIYYPWAKVRNRRYFYANSGLQNRFFEYHATGKQLFISFIISVVVFIAYITIQSISIVGSYVLLAMLLVAIPWLILKSLMFSMRMSSFSNVRFSFGGALVDSYKNYFLYPLVLFVGIIGLVFLEGLLLGLGIPAFIIFPLFFVGILAFFLYYSSYIKKKNLEFMINNSSYGQASFSTNLDLKTLLIIKAKSIGIYFLSFSIITVLAAVLVYMTVGIAQLQALGTMSQEEVAQAFKSPMIVISIFMIYAGIILSFIIMASYSMVKVREYTFASTLLDEKVSFASTLELSTFLWIMISNFFLLLFTFGLATPWVKVRTMKYMVEHTHVEAVDGFDEYVSKKEEEHSALGEELGDTFDIDISAGI